MLKLFQNSGMLLLVILSFWVSRMEQEVPLNKVAVSPSLSINGAELLYVASTPNPQPYGAFTHEIEQILSVTPSDSDIYIEEREGGKWYLKIEKLFSSESSSPEEVLPSVPATPQETAPSTTIDEPQFVAPSSNYSTPESLLV